MNQIKMFSIGILPKTRGCSKLSSHILHTSKLLTTKDFSFSSDSSESDSDKENRLTKKQVHKSAENTLKTLSTTDTNQRLKFLLQKLSEKHNVQKDNKYAESLNNVKPVIRQKKLDKLVEKPNIEKELPFNIQLQKAAQNIAAGYKGDSDQLQLELLSKVLNSGKPNENKDEEYTKPPLNLSNLLSEMKIENFKTTSFYVNKPHLTKSKILKYARQQSAVQSKSATKFLNSEKELNTSCPNLGIFKNMVQKEVKTMSKLSVWEAMEERDIKLLKWNPPENIFQELIKWTNEGKLWNFPINNEQGMEEQEKIHFSEHIFMERHLKNWCPKKGPVKHFMELVCTGLSKNPYMTVEEKVEHIIWYRKFFESKKDLLSTLDLLEKKSDLTIQEKKEIAA